MDFDFVNAETPDFDPQTYVRILMAIAKADKDNGPREYAYVQKQAVALGVDYDGILQSTGKDFRVERGKVTRITALMVLKDAIMLASMDRNFSLPERQRIYGYAQALDVPRKDVDALEKWVHAYRGLMQHWKSLVKAV